MSHSFNQFKKHTFLLACLAILGWNKSSLAQQDPVSTSKQTVYQHVDENIFDPSKNVYTYGVFNTAYVGHSWNTDDLNPETRSYVRLIKADYGSLPNSTITKVDFTFTLKSINGNGAQADVYLFNGDKTHTDPQTAFNNAFSSGGAFIKTVGTSSTTATSVTVSISNIHFKDMGNSAVFTLVLRPNYTENHVNQVMEVGSESIKRYASGPCDYLLEVQKFLLHNGNKTPTLNTVPVMCLGGSDWWINTNRTLYGGCTSLKTDIPLIDHKIFMSVWECRPDLTRVSPANYMEWEQTINRGSDTSVDWFDLKANLPPGGSDFFKADGVYELWLWTKKPGSVTPSTVGKRYFHVWTDNGSISNTTYSINLIQHNISISNSTIKNAASEEGLLEILAGNEILIVPGPGKSELLPNTWYRISAVEASCSGTFSVGITGPSSGNNSGTYTWTAVPSIPASQIAAYYWEASYDGVSYWPTGSTSSITQQLPLDKSLYLKLTVKSLEGAIASSNIYVRNRDASRLLNVEDTYPVADISVSPNPNSGSFTLSLANAEVKDIYVYDVIGQVVFSSKETRARSLVIDITGLPKGMYLVKVISSNGFKTIKVVVE